MFCGLEMLFRIILYLTCLIVVEGLVVGESVDFYPGILPLVHWDELSLYYKIISFTISIIIRLLYLNILLITSIGALVLALAFS